MRSDVKLSNYGITLALKKKHHKRNNNKKNPSDFATFGTQIFKTGMLNLKLQISSDHDRSLQAAPKQLTSDDDPLKAGVCLADSHSLFMSSIQNVLYRYLCF